MVGIRVFYDPDVLKCSEIGQVDLDMVDVVDAFPWTVDPRGRVRLYVGRRHRFGDRSGYCWRYRFVVQCSLERRLRSDEHVHHLDQDSLHDKRENLEVILAEYHGALHGFATPLARMKRGEFVEMVEPDETRRWPRSGAVLGPAAKKALTP